MAYLDEHWIPLTNSVQQSAPKLACTLAQSNFLLPSFWKSYSAATALLPSQGAQAFPAGVNPCDNIIQPTKKKLQEVKFHSTGVDAMATL